MATDYKEIARRIKTDKPDVYGGLSDYDAAKLFAERNPSLASDVSFSSYKAQPKTQPKAQPKAEQYMSPASASPNIARNVSLDASGIINNPNSNMFQNPNPFRVVSAQDIKRQAVADAIRNDGGNVYNNINSLKADSMVNRNVNNASNEQLGLPAPAKTFGGQVKQMPGVGWRNIAGTDVGIVKGGNDLHTSAADFFGDITNNVGNYFGQFDNPLAQSASKIIGKGMTGYFDAASERGRNADAYLADMQRRTLGFENPEFNGISSLNNPAVWAALVGGQIPNIGLARINPLLMGLPTSNYLGNVTDAEQKTGQPQTRYDKNKKVKELEDLYNQKKYSPSIADQESLPFAKNQLGSIKSAKDNTYKHFLGNAASVAAQAALEKYGFENMVGGNGIAKRVLPEIITEGAQNAIDQVVRNAVGSQKGINGNEVINDMAAALPVSLLFGAGGIKHDINNISNKFTGKQTGEDINSVKNNLYEQLQQIKQNHQQQQNNQPDAGIDFNMKQYEKNKNASKATFDVDKYAKDKGVKEIMKRYGISKKYAEKVYDEYSNSDYFEGYTHRLSDEEAKEVEENQKRIREEDSNEPYDIRKPARFPDEQLNPHNRVHGFDDSVEKFVLNNYPNLKNNKQSNKTAKNATEEFREENDAILEKITNEPKEQVTKKQFIDNAQKMADHIAGKNKKQTEINNDEISREVEEEFEENSSDTKYAENEIVYDERDEEGAPSGRRGSIIQVKDENTKNKDKNVQYVEEESNNGEYDTDEFINSDEIQQSLSDKKTASKKLKELYEKSYDKEDNSKEFSEYAAYQKEYNKRYSSKDFNERVATDTGSKSYQKKQNEVSAEETEEQDEEPPIINGRLSRREINNTETQKIDLDKKISGETPAEGATIQDIVKEATEFFRGNKNQKGNVSKSFSKAMRKASDIIRESKRIPVNYKNNKEYEKVMLRIRKLYGDMKSLINDNKNSNSAEMREVVKADENQNRINNTSEEKTLENEVSTDTENERFVEREAGDWAYGENPKNYHLLDTNGRSIGYIEYSDYGNDAIALGYVRNTTQGNKKGIGTKLVDKMVSENPGKIIVWDAVDKKAEKFKEAYSKKHPELNIFTSDEYNTIMEKAKESSYESVKEFIDNGRGQNDTSSEKVYEGKRDEFRSSTTSSSEDTRTRTIQKERGEGERSSQEIDGKTQNGDGKTNGSQFRQNSINQRLRALNNQNSNTQGTVNTNSQNQSTQNTQNTQQKTVKIKTPKGNNTNTNNNTTVASRFKKTKSPDEYAKIRDRITKLAQERRSFIDQGNLEASKAINTVVSKSNDIAKKHNVDGSTVRELMTFLREADAKDIYYDKKVLPKKDYKDLYKLYNKLSRQELTDLKNTADSVAEELESQWKDYADYREIYFNDDVAVGSRKNYILHQWDRANGIITKPAIGKKIKKTSNSEQERLFPTYKAGIDFVGKNGEVFKPKTLDMAELLKTHSNDIVTKVANGKFQKLLGNNILAPNKVKNQQGKERIISYSYNPEFRKPLEAILGKEIENQRESWAVTKAYDTVNNQYKRFAITVGSLFHHSTLSESRNSFGNNIESLLPTNALKTQFNAVSTALKNAKNIATGKGLEPSEIFKNIPEAQQALKWGVKLGVTNDLDIEKANAELEKVLGKKFGKKARQISEMMDRGLWDSLSNVYKMNTFNELVEKYKNNPKYKDGVPDNVMRELAQFVNDSFGGQNYDNLQISDGAVKVANRILLSTDWTLSTMIRQSASVLSSEKMQRWLNKVGESSKAGYELKELCRKIGIGSITNDIEAAGIRGKEARIMFTKALIQAQVRAKFMTGLGLIMSSAISKMSGDDDDELEPKDFFNYNNQFDREFINLLFPDYYIGKDDQPIYENGKKTGEYIKNAGKQMYVKQGKQFKEMPELIQGGLKYFHWNLMDRLASKSTPLFSGLLTKGAGKLAENYGDEYIKNKYGWKGNLKHKVPFTKLEYDAAFPSLTPFALSNTENNSNKINKIVSSTYSGINRSKSTAFAAGHEIGKKLLKGDTNIKTEEFSKRLRANGLKDTDTAYDRLIGIEAQDYFKNKNSSINKNRDKRQRFINSLKKLGYDDVDIQMMKDGTYIKTEE